MDLDIESHYPVAGMERKTQQKTASRQRRVNNIKRTSPFLSLPYELRRLIYNDVFPDGHFYKWLHPYHSTTRTISPGFDRLAPVTISLLRVCRLINEDVTAIVYCERQFELMIWANAEYLARQELFLQHLRPTTAARMKQIDITVSAWRIRSVNISDYRSRVYAITAHLPKIPSVKVVVLRNFVYVAREAAQRALTHRKNKQLSYAAWDNVSRLRAAATAVDTTATIFRRIDEVRAGLPTVWKTLDDGVNEVEEMDSMPQCIEEISSKTANHLIQTLRSRGWIQWLQFLTLGLVF